MADLDNVRQLVISLLQFEIQVLMSKLPDSIAQWKVMWRLHYSTGMTNLYDAHVRHTGAKYVYTIAPVSRT